MKCNASYLQNWRVKQRKNNNNNQKTLDGHVERIVKKSNMILNTH